MPLDVDSVQITGRWFRQTRRGSPPLPFRDPPPNNRWQRGAVVDALYLADRHATAWAEWYRHLAEAGVPPLHQMPRELWTWNVEVIVADLSTSERLGRVGLAVPRAGRRGWRAYQLIGAQLAREGAAGLIAPSAALNAGSVLCLFRRPTNGPVVGASPVGRPKLVRRPPPPPTGMTT